MQSNGGLLTASEARQHAVRTILSGPAGGIVGAVEMARLAGFEQALTFDMGGTSTDVALAGQKPRLTTEARIDGFPVRVPMLDIHTVGAGGGRSRKSMSAAAFALGPESAGARLAPPVMALANKPRSRTPMWCWAASRAISWWRSAAHRFAARTGCRSDCGAAGTADRSGRLGDYSHGNSNMERAIRAVSVERGEDPRDFPLSHSADAADCMPARWRRSLASAP